MVPSLATARPSRVSQPMVRDAERPSPHRQRLAQAVLSVATGIACLLSLSVTAIAGENPEPIHVFDGSLSFEHFGASVSSAGDWNDDGHADVLIGSSGGTITTSPVGRARVLSGKDGELLGEWKGTLETGRFGSAVAVIGDADQDGFVDIAVGGPREHSASVKDVGSVTVISGKTGEPMFVLFGESSGDSHGSSIAAMGDANLDGVDDLVVGIPGHDKGGTDTGAAMLYSGTGTVISIFVTSGAESMRLGTSVARAGFMSPAGTYPDVLLGGPGGGFSSTTAPPGLVMGFTAKGSSFLSLAGNEINSRFGSAIASDVDLNQDEIPDMIVGVPGYDKNGKEAGAVFVISGEDGQELGVWLGSSPGELFGSSVAIVPDADGDLAPDYLIGAPGSGSVYLLSGKTGENITVYCDVPGFGTAFSLVGDLNKDGVSDLAIGHPGATSSIGFEEAGRVQVFDGTADPQPQLALDDTSPIEVTWVKGSPLPEPAFRTVSNSGVDILTWLASTPKADGWLNIDPAAGSTPAGGPGQLVTIALDPSALPTGLHQSSITFENVDAEGSAIEVEVRLTVEDSPVPPSLCVDGPSSLVFAHQLGAPPPDGESFTLTNCGNLDLALPWLVELEDGGQGWLLADVVSGQILPGGEPAGVVIRAVVTDVLKPGVHLGTVRFTNLADPKNTTEIPVTLTVSLPSFTVGDRLVGAVGINGDEDAAAFFAAKGMTLKIKVIGKGSTLKPWLEIADDEGIPLKRWNLKGNGKNWKKKLHFQGSGVFQLRIGGRKESTGSYEVKTYRKLPTSSKTKVWSHITAVPGTNFAQVPVVALPGALLSANLFPDNFPFEELGGALVTPNGEVFDIGSFAVFSSGAMHLIKVPLGIPGQWNLRVTGMNSPNDKATVQAFPIQPGAGSSTIPIDG